MKTMKNIYPRLEMFNTYTNHCLIKYMNRISLLHLLRHTSVDTPIIFKSNFLNT